MNQFKQCICHNNLKALVAEGEASPIELAEAWASLFYEYCDLIEATETIYRTMLAHEINLYKKQNDLVAHWVKILQVQYIDNVAEAIRVIGFDFELNPADPDQYHADLLRISQELSYHRLQVRIKEAEYEAILENQSTQDSVDEKYFSTIFFRINNYAKREAVNGLTMVADYCAALKDFVAHCKTLKQVTNA